MLSQATAACRESFYRPEWRTCGAPPSLRPQRTSTGCRGALSGCSWFVQCHLLRRAGVVARPPPLRVVASWRVPGSDVGWLSKLVWDGRPGLASPVGTETEGMVAERREFLNSVNEAQLISGAGEAQPSLMVPVFLKELLISTWSPVSFNAVLLSRVRSLYRSIWYQKTPAAAAPVAKRSFAPPKRGALRARTQAEVCSPPPHTRSAQHLLHGFYVHAAASGRACACVLSLLRCC